MSEAPERILIIKMSAFGDIVCALPVLRALRAAFPQARIGWVVDERFRELVEREPELDEVIVAAVSRWGRQMRSPSLWSRVLAERAELKRRLRAGNWQVALDLQGLLKSGFVARMARCPRTLHMAQGRIGRRTWLFPGERIAEHASDPVGRMLPLAAAVGADISAPRFDFHVPPEDQAHADALLAAHDFAGTGPLVALNPGASAPHRRWPGARFVELATLLRGRLDARLVVTGAPSEAELARSITEEAGPHVLCAAGRTTYRQLAGLLSRCDAVVSADTGPMHLAVAVGRPVVALFGPSNPARTGPHGDRNIILHRRLPCWPCYARPTCNDSACMAAIEVEEVYEAVVRVLHGSGG